LSIGVLACSGGGPSTSSGFTSYSAVLGQDCAFRGTRPVRIDEITDGQSNTLLVGECTRTTIPWTKPDDIDIAFHSKLGDPAGFGSPHASGEGVNFAMADGRVEFLSTSLHRRPSTHSLHAMAASPSMTSELIETNGES